MWILMVEAGVAFFLLVFIVWWTMFSGRPDERKRPLREELPTRPAEQGEPPREP
ncbi:hypothetical protein G4G28_03670 [Massilia sp. Dwa41.01b]|uniref:hypothetical protein n=1 Tax=unclassified Massilia TaxID=2609279 RepID=UPI0016043B21|nr:MULTISPECIES: hypothetical protein [unclassified Massilia]QNA87795.1 hypothetical protein G4G28_03670 [Massilia sp. Dwa41.01b]QNA98697.1 hypothetical protein G4G31_07390 [Massilia sp. Se16.2.3]